MKVDLVLYKMSHMLEMRTSIMFFFRETSVVSFYGYEPMAGEGCCGVNKTFGHEGLRDCSTVSFQHRLVRLVYP